MNAIPQTVCWITTFAFAINVVELCLSVVFVQKRKLFFLLTASNAFLMELWGKRSDPYLQALQFIGTLGCTLCPLIVKPFLRGSFHGEPLNSSNATTAENSLDWTSEFATTLQPSSVTRLSVSVEEFHTNIHFVYIIVGSAAFVGALLHAVNIWRSNCNLQKITETRSEIVVAPHTKTNPEAKCQSCVTIGLLCAMTLFFCLVLDTFGSFVISFTVDHQSWTTSEATTLAAVFWGSITLSMLLGTILSNFVHCMVLLAIECLLSLAGVVFLACALPYTHVALWVGLVILGVGMGSMAPTILGVGKEQSKFISFLSSAILTSGYVGRIVAPPIIGFILDNMNPMWFAYIGVIYTAAVTLLFVVLISFVFANKGCAHSKPEVTPNNPEAISLA